MKKRNIDIEYEINNLLNNLLSNGKVYSLNPVEEFNRLLNYYLDPKNILREERLKKLEKLNGKK